MKTPFIILLVAFLGMTFNWYRAYSRAEEAQRLCSGSMKLCDSIASQRDQAREQTQKCIGMVERLLDICDSLKQK